MGHSLEKIFKELLFANTLRGPHSTGVFKVEKNRVDWRKAAVAGPDFLNLKKVPEFLNNFDKARYVVGHNRWASRGAVITDNAHPFEHKNITLVHNGTLFYTGNLPGDKKFDVDSEVLTHAFAEEGEEEVLPKIKGSFALVWYNTKTRTLNLFRNSERPLFLGKTYTGIYFAASEKEMLKWVLERNKTYLEETVEVPVRTLLTFTAGEEKPKLRLIQEKWGYSSTPYSNAGWTMADRARMRLNGWFGGALNDDDDLADDFSGAAAAARAQAAAVVVDPPKSNVIVLPDNSEKIVISEAPESPGFIRTGDWVEFALSDWNKVQPDARFVSIEGDFPKDAGKNFIIRGNFSGTVKELDSTRNLLRGRVSSTFWNRKEQRNQVDVSNLVITDKLDPFYEKAIVGEPAKATVSSFKEAVTAANKPNVTLIKCHNKLCDVLLDLNGRGASESGVIVYKTGGARRYCLDCYKQDVNIPTAEQRAN